MPSKNKSKKRKSTEVMASLAGLHHLTGLETAGLDQSLADCLTEFGGGATSTTKTKADESSSPSSSYCQSQHLDLDCIQNWNAAFLRWNKTKAYTPGLLPNIDEEVARHFQVQTLSKFLLGKAADLRMPVMERWLLDVRLEDQATAQDPVLPVVSVPHSPASQRLVEELVEHGLDQEKAESIVAELCRSANVAGQALVAQTDRYQRSSPLKKGDRLVLEEKNKTVTILYSRKKWKKPFCFPLNREHYEKLKGRFFDQIHNAPSVTPGLDSREPQVLRGFHVILVAVLLRYSSLSGGQLLQDLRGGGMQGAVHEEVFESLRQNFAGDWMEGFASPWNATLPVFGSAFPDVDWHFGSIGSFLEMALRGRCQANPPFSPGLMTAMVDHMESQLDLADRQNRFLTLCIVVPTASANMNRVVQRAAAASFQRMVSSPYFRHHLILSARDHGYIEGAQHLKPTRYKQSSYDTSVVLLQSEVDRQRPWDENAWKHDIQQAFASRHDEELQQRRRTQVAKTDVADES